MEKWEYSFAVAEKFLVSHLEYSGERILEPVRSSPEFTESYRLEFAQGNVNDIGTEYRIRYKSSVEKMSL